MVDLVERDLIDVASALRHSRYIDEKLAESEQRMKDPDAKRFEHDEFWDKVREL